MEKVRPSRRAVLAGAAGVGGLLLAATATGTAQAAPDGGAAVHGFDTVADLLAYGPEADGTLALVGGYAKGGDGGGGGYRWSAKSTVDDNGGTVLKPSNGKGRWLALHDGTVDFRRFGIFGTDRNADAALDAMVHDPAVARIEAHTDLNFAKRHTFARSDIELDFGGNTVHSKGIEPNTHDNPFGAVLYFRGKVAEKGTDFTTTEAIAELSDVFQVADSGAFTVGDWYALEVNLLNTTWERELQKLVQITELVDKTHVRVNYQNGWAFAAGRTFTWRKVEPVVNASVRNMVFVGVGGDELSGSHPVAYEYAVRCDVSQIHGTATFWPVVMRRWCTHFRTSQCSLTNPPAVDYGGAGYLTQQIYCLYGHVEDCHTSNARHLNDWTASAYCYVTNCHGDGDDQGPFVTHGQYEHDLVYTGCSGLMTFANSGAPWGSSAKRITVRRHVCSWFVARVKVTDLTLEDVKVIGKAGLDGSGMIWVNADGVQMRGCEASDTFIVSQTSNRSARPNVISGCVIPATPTTQVIYPGQKANEIVQANVTSPVHFDRCRVVGLSGNAFSGTGELRFTDCVVTGPDDADPATFAAGAVLVEGGALSNVGISLAGAKDQRLRIGGGATVSGTNTAKALLSRTGGDRTVTWDLGDYASTAPDGTAHVSVDAGTNRYRAVGARFSGGRIALSDKGFGPGSYLLHTSNVEAGVDRSVPADGKSVQTGGNLRV
ncbi:hypothetical protein [Actinocatenispora rupis]|uniref:Peptidase C14 n=1 Tax=Actinocatenispora rupis TaxID=519421 RepID=A0A8J3J977_9ACTN|nr:hypothetical protein [Actinocatenispora rupis]GID10623.1 hypothetical protein Aru02nite_15120 [Actinocatenispora rupis]